MSASAKWLAAFCLSAALGASADDAPRTATVVGVEVPIDAAGRPVVDAALRRQLVENLRASFAAAGLPATSSPLRVRSDGVESMRLGLDRASLAVARVDEKGRLELQCVHGDEEAARFLLGEADE